MDPAWRPEAEVDSRLSLEWTYTYDKLSCMRSIFPFHLFCAYTVFASGLACLATRVVRPLHPAHKWCGRVYIVSMLWATGTSLLIHNTGLPIAVLWSFLWALGGLTIGWLLICVHRERAAAAAAAAATKALESGAPLPPGGVRALLAEERAAADGARGFWRRLFGLRALHGMIMFVSWINVAGRVFATPASLLRNFDCGTYTYYKQIDSHVYAGAGKPLTPVPPHDPRYARLPWARLGAARWGAVMLVGPLVLALVIGAAWSAGAARAAAAARRRGAGGAAAPHKVTESVPA